MRKLKVQKLQVADNSDLQERAEKIKSGDEKLTMLSAINNILELAEDSGLSTEFFELADTYIKYVSELQDITPIQAVMLSFFIDESVCCNRASISDLARFLCCRAIRVMEYQTELEELVVRGMLYRTQRNRFETTAYVAPHRMIESLNKNEPYQKISYACNGIKLFQYFYDITHLRFEECLSSKLMMEEVIRLFEENRDCYYVKTLKSLGLSEDDELIITHLSRHLVLSGTDSLSIDHMLFLFDDPHDRNDFGRSMEDGSNELFKRGLIERAFDGGFRSREEYRLSDKARTLLLKEYNIKISDNEVHCDVIKSNQIVSKELYFETHVQQQLQGMAELLTEEHYQNICTRLKEKGLRLGIACLFYGLPGTGKTETVMQLARRSGRDIMQVNISQVKSMWVGESEKNIKAIFDRYRSIAMRSAKMPILLFNEADAVIGKRKEGADGAVEKMENAIQNIILQEMESLDGIMIATTNLVQNLDKAFERRFLYKVKFEKPTDEQRRNIWKSMMPILGDDVAGRLANCYDFSGGQIENIARRCDIETILHGEEAINEERIEMYCQEELIDRKNKAKIGFV